MLFSRAPLNEQGARGLVILLCMTSQLNHKNRAAREKNVTVCLGDSPIAKMKFLLCAYGNFSAMSNMQALWPKEAGLADIWSFASLVPVVSSGENHHKLAQMARLGCAQSTYIIWLDLLLLHLTATLIRPTWNYAKFSSDHEATQHL